MTLLERQLAASIREAQDQKVDDLKPWLDATPMPPKRLRRKKMTTAIQKSDHGALAAAVVIRGDLSALNEAQLSTYYIQLCESLELNHLTRPFSLLTLNGKKVFYANRDCTDQLRRKHSVSVTIVSRERSEDLIVVTARATLPDGRTDESIGALPLGKLQGEPLANALMKAETKAKRRVTLSICGLGFMDESEVEGALADNQHHGQRLEHSPAEMPGDSQEPQENATFTGIMVELEGIETRLTNANPVTYEMLLKIRSIMGQRDGAPTQMTRDMSELNLGDAISPGQKKELGKLWNRIDRQVKRYESIVPPPGPEQSFEDDEPEPGSNG